MGHLQNTKLLLDELRATLRAEGASAASRILDGGLIEKKLGILLYSFRMSLDLLILVIVNIAAIAAVGLFIASRLKKQGSETDDREIMKSLINEVFGEVTQKVTEQSKSILKGEQELISHDLKNKHAEIEKIVGELRRELTERQRDLRGLEQERNKQFSEIATHVREHQKITEKLSQDTTKLRNLLSNNQQRGQWGEYILEDILRTAGLVENVHYSKQVTLGDTGVKPDITILLPNERKVAVDVKFPYTAVIKLAEAETAEAKAAAKKLFAQDVKTKVKQIIERGYINPNAGTLDYAIMFVPNEDLFSFINQQAPDVIDEAIQKKVMIVSPFTFLIVARTIMESYRNFMIENNLKEIIKYIGDFADEWGRFEGEFTKFDEVLAKLRTSYDQIATTRFNRMRMRIGRVEEYRLGLPADAKSVLPEKID